MSDQIPPIPDVPPKLREAAQRGILIPFIGAGVSILAGCPGWAKFADGALRCFIDKGKFSYSQLDQISHLNPRVKLSLARALEEEHRIPIDFRVLLHPSERMEHEKGRRLYRSLFKLGKVFVTTNYDEWLDEEIPEPTLSPATKSDPTQASKPKPMNVIHKIDGLTLANLDQPNTVIHLHGSVRDSTKMILTTQDYVNHYAYDRFAGEAAKENPVLTFLDYLFNNRTVLFIGYGLEELEILEYVILKARRPPGSDPAEIKHYIIQGFFSHEEELMRSLKSYYLKECGIQLLPFLRDQKDWDQLLNVLEEFARIIPVSEPLVLQKRQDMEDLLNG
jgi:hypothetical protein